MKKLRCSVNTRPQSENSPPTDGGEWPLKDRTDPLRMVLMGSYMSRVTDVLEFYEVLTRTVHAPLLGKYFFRPIVNLYGAKYHSGRAIPLRDVVSVLRRAESIVVTECACRVWLNRCGHSTRTCLKINSGAETQLERGRLKSERISTDEAVGIVERAARDGLMLNLEWCVEPYTYSICCCCGCCCVERRLRFGRGIESAVMNSQYLPRFDAVKCAGCGECERVCPGKAISVSGGVRAVDERNCVGCGLCELHCDSGAVTLAVAREIPVAKDRGLFHHYLIYVSSYFVLVPHFIVYLLLKGDRIKRARGIEW